MFEYVSSQIQTPKGELYPNSSIDIAKNMNLELCPSLSYLMISPLCNSGAFF